MSLFQRYLHKTLLSEMKFRWKMDIIERWQTSPSVQRNTTGFLRLLKADLRFFEKNELSFFNRSLTLNTSKSMNWNINFIKRWKHKRKMKTWASIIWSWIFSGFVQRDESSKMIPTLSPGRSRVINLEFYLIWLKTKSIIFIYLFIYIYINAKEGA